MKKLAVILDSFSGRDKKTVEKMKDHYFLPLRVIIDGKEYYDDGTTKNAKELMAEANKAADVKTSQPSPAMVEELFKKLSKEYEGVIYICLGSALSGTYQTAKVMAKDFDNVEVINNFLVGRAFEELSTHLIEEATKGATLNELVQTGTEYGKMYPTYVVPKDNKSFIKSGRLGKAAAFMLQKMHAVPIIGFEDTEKLHKKMIKRSGGKAIDYAIEKLLENVPKPDEVQFMITHTLDEEFVKIAKSKFKEKGITNVAAELAAAIINAHTGDGSISIGAYKKFK